MANRYTVGIALITVGTVGLVGVITGRLASMLAALFAPNLLGAPGPAPINVPTMVPPTGGFGSTGGLGGLEPI